MNIIRLVIALIVLTSVITLPVSAKDYTQGDVDAILECAEAIALGEFKENSPNKFGGPKSCNGIKAHGLEFWRCVNKELKTQKFEQAMDNCEAYSVMQP